MIRRGPEPTSKFPSSCDGKDWPEEQDESDFFGHFFMAIDNHGHIRGIGISGEASELPDHSGHRCDRVHEFRPRPQVSSRGFERLVNFEDNRKSLSLSVSVVQSKSTPIDSIFISDKSLRSFSSHTRWWTRPRATFSDIRPTKWKSNNCPSREYLLEKIN